MQCIASYTRRWMCKSWIVSDLIESCVHGRRISALALTWATVNRRIDKQYNGTLIGEAMLEGLYGVIFGTPDGELGAGVVVFSNGKLSGGDLSYFYTGAVRSRGGDTIEADVDVEKYQFGGESVFGDLDRFRLQLAGVVEPHVFALKGHVVGQPAMQITAQCTKLADL